ncbi:MAG: DUF3987 domain-containing protein [Methylococcus sp.]
MHDDGGWYVYHDDGIPAGAFGDWRTGEQHTWRADIGRTLSPAEEAVHRQRLTAMKDARDAAMRDKRAEAADKAARLWTPSRLPGAHAYLARKGIETRPENLRALSIGEVSAILGYHPQSKGEWLEGEILLAPITLHGEIASCELIDEQGRKSAIAGGQKSGGCWEACHIPDEAAIIAIGEGIATVLSVRLATGWPVVAALSAGNLLAIAEQFHASHPAAELIILADLVKTTGEPDPHASKAAQTVGGRLAAPDFGSGRPAGATDFNDLHQLLGLAAVRAQVTKPGGGSQTQDEALPDLLIPAGMAVPAIAANCLPGWLGEMAAAVAAFTQTPEAASVMVILAVLATAMQRRYEVSPFAGYREILALWTMTVLPTGNRKSALMDPLTAPLTLWERRARERIQSDQARAEAERVVCEKRLESLKKRAANAEEMDARKAVVAEIEAELRRMPEPVNAPRLFSSDVTVERLQQLLTEHNERFAILTDEGGVFAIMAGAYSGGHASIDAFLQGHSGSPLRVDRGGRTAQVDRPALSFGLMLQPGVLGDTGKNKRFRDSGLMARFLFAVPPSNVGERDIRRRMAIPDRVRTAYQENLLKLLDDRLSNQQPEILTFAPEAEEVWTVFAETIERRHGAGRELEHLTEWTAKLSGAVARIAGLLHLAMHGGANTIIARAEVAMAVQLGELLIAHAVAAFALMGVSKAEEDAEALIRWLKAERRDGFLLRDVQRSLRARFPRKDKIEEAIRLLEDWGVIIGRREQRAGPKGGRPTVAYLVHPHLHR